MKYAYIVATPGTGSGKPRIDGTRIKVEMIAEWIVHLGQAPEDVQKSHPHLTLAQLHSALAYYYDHRDEIDRALEEGHKLARDVQRLYPSRLQERQKTQEQSHHVLARTARPCYGN